MKKIMLALLIGLLSGTINTTDQNANFLLEPVITITQENGDKSPKADDTGLLATITPTALIKKVMQAQMNILAPEKLSPANEQYIRDFIQELNITQKIKIRKLSPAGIAVFGQQNALARYNYLIVGESFFNQMSEEERRFLLAHELGHIENKHFEKFIGIQAASFSYTAALCAYFSYLYFTNQLPDFSTMTYKQIIKYLAPRYALLSAINMGIVLLQNKISRIHEYQADAFAIEQVKTAVGGIQFCKNNQSAYDVQENASMLPGFLKKFFYRSIKPYFETHPRPDARIASIKTVAKTNNFPIN